MEKQNIRQNKYMDQINLRTFPVKSIYSRQTVYIVLNRVFA